MKAINFVFNKTVLESVWKKDYVQKRQKAEDCCSCLGINAEGAWDSERLDMEESLGGTICNIL